MSFEKLKGETLLAIYRLEKGSDEALFVTKSGKRYIMYHDQDCCENVEIEDVCGDIKDLIGSEILLAEEVTSNDNPKDKDDDSFTWTFYKLSTIKGSLTIRWYGVSNGYYSETVSFRIDNRIGEEAQKQFDKDLNKLLEEK